MGGLEADLYEPVLVLNANFEPIHVCTTRRALGLVFSGKASLVMNGRGEVRTVSLVSSPINYSISTHGQEAAPGSATHQARNPAA